MKLFWQVFSVLCSALSIVSMPYQAAAEVVYTPLLTTAMFDGPKADLLLAANGSLLFIFIVLGLGLIARVLMK